MKLDPKGIRYLTAEDWRVLTAVEMGSKNHEIVPVSLITQIASLRSGSGIHKCISNLAKANLISKIKNAKYDGYRLTYGGIDYLALNTHRKAECIYSVGNQIGVGKESDIFVVASPSGKQQVLKIHRLGRISFRTVKANRDYLRNRSSGSWMYMSRLAALKEHAFMKALWDHGFPVPQPLAQNRHTVVMTLVDGFPLRQVSSVPDPPQLYAELMALIVRLAHHGLIHGDFNEFNIMIEDLEDTTGPPESSEQEAPADSKESAPETKLKPVIIDFPQMVSTSHPNAEYYFDRDVACIKRFFSRRFKFTSDDPGPTFEETKRGVASLDSGKRLDALVEASGFSKKMARELDAYMKEVGVDGDGVSGDGETRETSDDDEPHVESSPSHEEPLETPQAASEHIEVSEEHPESIKLWPTPSPIDVMTPLDIQDMHFRFHEMSTNDPVSPVGARKTKADVGWAI